ncbi:hypothetical protein [Halomonas sp. E19]|uniref:hypothetical protein n=1 Tax=Halomonas sp. E19 TaxID=3397247 RepID=UPI00403395A9
MPTIRLPLRNPIALMLAVALAGCAGTPDLSELRAQVEPPPGLVVSNDAELDVRLVGAGGTLAETHVTPRGPGPGPWCCAMPRRETTPRYNCAPSCASRAA